MWLRCDLLLYLKQQGKMKLFCHSGQRNRAISLASKRLRIVQVKANVLNGLNHFPAARRRESLAENHCATRFLAVTYLGLHYHLLPTRMWHKLLREPVKRCIFSQLTWITSLLLSPWNCWKENVSCQTSTTSDQARSPDFPNSKVDWLYHVNWVFCVTETW